MKKMLLFASVAAVLTATASIAQPATQAPPLVPY